jgi:hypothetical protein
MNLLIRDSPGQLRLVAAERNWRHEMPDWLLGAPKL